MFILKRTIPLLLLYCSIAIAQKPSINPEMIKLGWTFASPLIMGKINDPLAKEMIRGAIPKIIDYRYGCKNCIF